MYFFQFNNFLYFENLIIRKIKFDQVCCELKSEYFGYFIGFKVEFLEVF